MPRPTNRKNRTGIMTLLAFSMPPETPIAMMANEATIATIIHGRLLIATTSKWPTMAAISWPMACMSPVMAIAVYLKIQPMTTV